MSISLLKNPAVLLGAGSVLLIYWGMSRQNATALPEGFTERDVDHMARTLYVETGLRHDPQELGQITWVAINRARKYGKTVAEVVNPDARPTWFGGIKDSNRNRWNTFHSHARYDEAKTFVRDIFLGKTHPNLIGDRTHFLHPGGMPRCDEAPGAKCSATRICTATSVGRRCLPKWNVDGYASVVSVGKGRFS